MTLPDPWFVFREHDRGAEWGGERYQPAKPTLGGRGDLWRGIVGVLLALLVVCLLSWWITGEAPFQAHANPGPIFADGFEGEAEGAPVPFSCSHPNVQPAWMTGTQKLWSQLFTPRDGAPVPTYPNSLGFPVPIGASKGAWEAGKFTALPEQTVNLVWDRAQAKPNEGYFVARPADSMFLSISPCPGDLRPASFVATDFLAPGCRKRTNEGTINYTTRAIPPVSTLGACKLVAGEIYYLTVSPVNPDDGLTPGEHTCSDVPSSQSGCDAQARSRGN